MELNCERDGAGQPLLLVHGLGGSVRSWDSIAPMLGRAREVVLVDLPGHGQSPPLAGRQTIAAYADALERFIERNDLAGEVAVFVHAAFGQIFAQANQGAISMSTAPSISDGSRRLCAANTRISLTSA